jgi:uncharacterized protein (TIGR03437 family)
MRQFVPAVFAAGVCSALWAQSPTINDFPSRQFGQLRLLPFAQATSAAPNLVEGRELNGPGSLAFDTSVSPPILYAADTGNNRVLAWRNPAARSAGDKADLVVGQRDLLSTLQLGPGTTLSTGLRFPTSVAVDRNGNLYVLDAGNNRILRYPSPFRQTSDPLVVDLVIGQRSASSGNALNQGQAQPSEKTLAFQQFGQTYVAGMAFDSLGNLWVTDALNNRVLRFPAANLAAGTLEPAADVALGQSTFNSAAVPPDPPGQTGALNKSVLVQPAGLAFDQFNRLYVVDLRFRVLFYRTPATGVPADRVLGIPAQPPPGQQITYPNRYNVGAFTPQGSPIRPPESVFTSGNNVFVVDSGDSRILRFNPPEAWPPESQSAPSPQAEAVIGQADFVSNKTNRGQPDAHAAGLSRPLAAAFLDSDLWIADGGNNRVVSLPQAGTFVFGAATRVLGQYSFNYSSPNLVEGRELWVNSPALTGGAVVVDKNSTPPRLYIADTMNNRVLGFRDARAVGVDARGVLEQRADLVIGQPDVFRSTVNFPSGDDLVLSDTALRAPTGLALDPAGNLWVADTGNGRVLRFPAPFSQPPGSLPRATVVLGQIGFTTPPVKDAGIANLSAPFGLALLANGSLAVSDFAHNRVVIFRRPPGGDFSNSQPASLVLGQLDFSSQGAGPGPAQMRGPRHIAVDSSDRLYVMDTGNNRMMVFTNLAISSNGAASVLQLPNLNAPFGIAVSGITGEIWVTNSGSNAVYRYAEFQQLQLTPNPSPTAQIQVNGPIGLALDSFDNLVVVEGINRVTFFYAKAVSQHAASYNLRPLVPGQLAYLYRLGKPFAFEAADGTAFNPWPTTLGDIQVSVNGIPAPIFRVNAERIDFQVPMSAPSSGTAEFLVQRASTGEILAAVTQVMAVSNPGFFTANAAGTGQAAAVNEDGSINGPASPVGRGQIISFYLTGQGYVDGAPPDGSPPTGPTPTPVKPVLLSPNCGPPTCIPAGVLPPTTVEYSGLGAFAGGWQINFRVPEAFPPGNNNVIVVTMNDIQSNIGPTSGIVVTFSVR